MERENVHLLVIEDNPRFLNELLEWLKDFGYQEITTATSTAEAQKNLGNPCDIIIADMRMERDDSGFTILDWVKKNNLSTVVIILTANDTVADCRRAFKEKVWDYISKNMKGSPFDAVDASIQDAIVYLNRWGNYPNQQWLEENFKDLQAKYWGQWIAVVNQAVIENADTEEELLKRLEERQLRRFTTTIQKFGDFRPISDLIQLEESDRLEFKSTLQWDVRQNTKNPQLQNSSLKTIVAFLNTLGGTLIIGVEDDGNVLGLDLDLNCFKKGSLDLFERHLTQLIQNKIGIKFMPYIKIRFANIEGKDVCGVYVNQSPKRAFLKKDNGIELYVRTGNSTRLLSVPEVYDYLH
ncbi:MAG: putative DNA binding domain-containing protein [Jaaginema sp. PMC 1079.18]|nr:putative DNA binding domain-containing protein [Jaaginema sp. PMC 1080.18]MEC4851965.1 putative DNA binding domain-containing protein [Jaaginema sp. PMC 1079.18]MEC4868428.1 putative DNA binding domain-containing protein [Jaaginema sp. PMC 1078.18]